MGAHTVFCSGHRRRNFWFARRLSHGPFRKRRVLTFSILFYAGSALASGYATSLQQLLILRCLVFIGVCVEFVAAVAWVAELFPEAKRREKILGFTQAFSSLGGFLIGVVNVLAAKIALDLPAIHGGHEAWRYTLISGVIPALPLILIRPFLPESPEWQRKRDAGQLRRPSIAELFSPELCRTTIVTTLIFAASYGIAFGAIQQLPQILGAPKGHAQIVATAKAAQDRAVATAKEKGQPAPAPGALKQISRNATDAAVAKVAISQEIGGLVGRLAFACIAAWAIFPKKSVSHFPNSIADFCAAAFLVDFKKSWQRGNIAAD